MVSDSQYEQSLATRVREFTAKRLRRFFVTSAGPSEGKSSIVAGLGRALVGSGTDSVLLVEANPIHSDLHHAFGVPAERGLTDLLGDLYFIDLGRENPAQFGLGDWLEILRAQAKTGELVIAEGNKRFAIRIVRGSISSISSGVPGNPDSLGELLLRPGLISASQRDDALRLQEDTGRPLGAVLRTLELVTEGNLTRTLLDQAGRSLRELITLHRPSCRFTETAESYRSVTAGRSSALPEQNGIDELVTGNMYEYLKSPFLGSQLPMYFTDTGVPSLKLLQGGTRPSELLDPSRSRALGLLLDRLSRVFDIILVDGADVGTASHTTTLAGQLDGTLLVVRVDQVDAGTIRQAVRDLQRDGAQVLGVILNEAEGLGRAAAVGA